MNVLSLFDGLSGCRIALERIGVTPNKYYASEIDKYAIKVAQANYPDTVQLGSVTDWQSWDIDWSSIDLVTGGFPCQAWSVAGKQQGDKDERGMLFWTMLDVMKTVMTASPKAKFLIENVKMKKEFEQYITHHTEQALGEVHKTLINSALVSAQNRNRYYWTNFPVGQPEDKGIVLADIIEDGFADREKSLSVTTRVAGATEKRYLEKSMHQMVFCGSIVGRKINPTTGKRDDYNQDLKAVQRLEVRADEKTGTLTTVQKDNVLVVRATVQANAEYTYNGKVPTLTASMGVGGGNVPLMTDSETADKYKGKYIDSIERLLYRKLTPLECERLQTLPDSWTLVLDENGKQLVSNTQRYKMIGNGWTIDVIAHILKQSFK
jgi:DNA-cytosine methyltransferase